MAMQGYQIIDGIMRSDSVIYIAQRAGRLTVSSERNRSAIIGYLLCPGNCHTPQPVLNTQQWNNFECFLDHN